MNAEREAVPRGGQRLGDGGTQVRVEQAGFRPDQEQNIRGAQFGWTRFLGQLDTVVAKLD